MGVGSSRRELRYSGMTAGRAAHTCTLAQRGANAARLAPEKSRGVFLFFSFSIHMKRFGLICEATPPFRLHSLPLIFFSYIAKDLTHFSARMCLHGPFFCVCVRAFFFVHAYRHRRDGRRCGDNLFRALTLRLKYS